MYNCNCIVYILAYATGSGPSVSKFHSIVSVKLGEEMEGGRTSV